MPRSLPDSPKYKEAMRYFKGVLASERRIRCIEAEIERQQSRLALNGVEGGEQVSRTMEGDAMERGFVKLYDFCDALDTELIGYVEDLTGRPVTILDKPISGSDDMSVISQAVPTTYFVMGTGSEDEGVRYPVHNSRVVFDESVFVEGAAMTATMALRWLEARARDDKENER